MQEEFEMLMEGKELPPLVLDKEAEKAEVKEENIEENKNIETEK